MKLIHRVFSGGSAAALRFAATILVQIGLVPVFLNTWSAEQYGLYLTVQAAILLLFTLENAHQNFLQGYFYSDPRGVQESASQVFAASRRFSLFLFILTVFASAIWIFLGFEHNEQESVEGYFGSSTGIWILYLSLIANLAVWSFVSMRCSFYVRAATTTADHHRFAWWALFQTVLVAPSVALTASYGYSVANVLLVQAIFTLGFDLMQLRFAKRILVKRIGELKTHSGIGAYTRSQMFSIGGYFTKNLSDLIRGAGIRFILGSSMTSSKVGEFATLRTLANLPLQFGQVVAVPLTPELSKELSNRNQDSTRPVLIWRAFIFASIACSCVSLILPETLIQKYYGVWTRGRYEFDLYTFQLLLFAGAIWICSVPLCAIASIQNRSSAVAIPALVSSALLVAGVYTAAWVDNLNFVAWSVVAAEGCNYILLRILLTKEFRNDFRMRVPLSQAFALDASLALIGLGNLTLVTFDVSILYRPLAVVGIMLVCLLMLKATRLTP